MQLPIATLFTNQISFDLCYFAPAERQNKIMRKVVYSIKKVRGNSDDKISGLGFLNEEGTLLCKCVSKNGKRYTRAFDEVEQHCHPIIGKENEFKGYVTMYYEYDGRDIEVEYSVWYKIVEEN